MEVQVKEQQTGQRRGIASFFERIGEAQIEGERQRLAKMTTSQRARDFTARKFVSGIFAFFNALIILGLLISSFVAYPLLRIPLVVLIVVVFWLIVRKGKK